MAIHDPAQERLSDACDELTRQAHTRGLLELSLLRPEPVAVLTEDDLCSGEPGRFSGSSKIDRSGFHRVLQLFSCAVELHRLAISPSVDLNSLKLAVRELWNIVLNDNGFQGAKLFETLARSKDRSPTLVAEVYMMQVFECIWPDWECIASSDVEDFGAIAGQLRDRVEIFRHLQLPNLESNLARIESEFSSVIAIQDAEPSLKPVLIKLHSERFATGGLEPAKSYVASSEQPGRHEAVISHCAGPVQQADGAIRATEPAQSRGAIAVLKVEIENGDSANPDAVVAVALNPEPKLYSRQRPPPAWRRILATSQTPQSEKAWGRWKRGKQINPASTQKNISFLITDLPPSYDDNAEYDDTPIRPSQKRRRFPSNP